jgi:hypothetical protein
MTYVAISDIAPAELDALAFVKGSLKRSENSGATLSVDLGPAGGRPCAISGHSKRMTASGIPRLLSRTGSKFKATESN